MILTFRAMQVSSAAKMFHFERTVCNNTSKRQFNIVNKSSVAVPFKVQVLYHNTICASLTLFVDAVPSREWLSVCVRAFAWIHGAECTFDRLVFLFDFFYSDCLIRK
jgi:hypothetical protein